MINLLHAVRHSLCDFDLDLVNKKSRQSEDWFDATVTSIHEMDTHTHANVPG